MGRDEGQGGLAPLFESMYTVLWHFEYLCAMSPEPSPSGLSNLSVVYLNSRKFTKKLKDRWQLPSITRDIEERKAKRQTSDHIFPLLIMISALGRYLKNGYWTAQGSGLG